MTIPTVTAQQMKEADRIMTEDLNISVIQIMENAGRLLANAAQEIFSPKSAVVLVGPGNNGADGLVAARYLHNKNINVEVVLSTDEGDLSEIGAGHLDTLKRMGIPVSNSIGKRPDVFIDCLLGYNAKGAPHGRVAELIREAKVLESSVISCDVPSGFNLTSGQWHDPAFKGSVCVTLGLPKKGMILNSGIKMTLVGDIGIPPEVYKKIGVDVPNIFLDKDLVEIAKQEDEESITEEQPEEDAEIPEEESDDDSEEESNQSDDGPDDMPFIESN
ncbi:MAG: NAD(P)H-hydrate epimerase [Nanoarchaeota archaeon]|nr:NAD(P)H-hydrate epimerase [Nanoarchaeota archaeon]